MGKTKAPKETQQTAAKDGPSAPQAQARPNGAQPAPAAQAKTTVSARETIKNRR